MVIVLAMTLVIPAGDLVAVATYSSDKPIYLLLHMASGLLFATLTFWVWTASSDTQGPGRG